MATAARIAKWIGIALGALILLLAVLLAVLQAGPVKRAALDYVVAAAVGGGPTTARVAAVEGFVPFSIRLRDVEIGDADGVWLRAGTAEMDWRPLALLGGRVHVDRLAFAGVAVERLPASEEEEPVSLALPEVPVPVLVDDITLNGLSLGPAVLGEAARLRAEGSLALGGPARDARAHLLIERLDGGGGRAELTLARAAGSDALDLRLAAQEPAGGIIARLAELPGLPPVRVELDGDGPAEGWSGHLVAAAEGVARLDTDVRLALVEPVRLGLSGTAEVGGLLPPDLAGVVPASLGLAAELGWTPGARLTVDRFALTAPGESLALSADIDQATGRLSATTRIEAADAGWIGRFVPGVSAGAVSLETHLDGSLQAPVLSLDARVGALRTAQASAEEAELHLRDLAPAPGADAAGGLPRRFTGQGDGRFTGLRVEAPGLDLGPLLAQPVEWSFAGTVDLAAGAADFQSVEVTAGDLALFGAGTASEAFSRLAASFSLRAADLAALSPLAGLPPGATLSGAAAIDAEVGGSLEGPDLVATLGGSLDDLHTGVPTSDALLGGHVALGGRVTLRGDTLSAEGLRLAGPALRLTADGTAGETLDVNVTAELPDLAVLSQAVAAPLEGSLRLAATVTGTAAAPRVHVGVDGRRLGAAGARLAALGGTVDVADALARPRLEANLEGRDFALEEQSFDRIGLALTASAAEAGPRGRVALELHRGADLITVQTDFDRPEPSTLRLSGLSVRGPGMSLDGTVRLAGGVASGRVAGTVADLAAFAAFGVPLRGRADFAIDLAGAQGRQRIMATADAAGLAVPRPDAPTLGIDTLHLEGGVEDAFGAPRIDLAVTAAGVRQADTTLRTASVTVRGPMEALAFSVQAEGEAAGPGGEPPQPVSLTTAGTLSTRRTRTSLEIGSLEARYAGQSLKLLHAATAAWGGGRIELHGLEAQAGQDGRLAAEAALGADAVSATVTARALPLAMVAAVSPGLDLSGTLDADMTISGTPAQPEGRMRLRFAGVRSGALGGADVAAVGGTIEAMLEAGILSATAALDGPPGVTLSASLDVPVVPAPSADGAMPAIPVPAPDAPLTGRVDGTVDLSLLPGIIDLAGDRLGGRAEARLAISGTVAAPDISGQVRLADASYESAELGTVVRHLDAEAVGDRGRIVLRSLSARDGEDGRLTATGTLDLAAGDAMPFRLDARLDDFLLLQRDDATVAADGTVAVERTAGGGTVDGALTVRSAELRIPEPQPPQIVKLDVVEIDAPPTLHRISPEPAGPAGAAPAPAAAPWRLDVTIDLPGQVFVRGRGLDSEWRGRMAIRGTAEAPDITGRLEAVRGSFSILERTLTLDRGVITFTGGATVDPTLEVASSTQVEGTRVELAVGGTLTDPKIEATSDTGLPQDEVLAMLLFGKRLGALTPAQAVQLASAAGTLTGGGPDVLDTIRRSVGLDFLGIQSAEGEAAGAGGETIDASALRAGKYLTEDVFVHVDQGLTPESRRVGVEVRVLPETLPGVTVNSDVGADARSSVGVNWKYDY